MGPNPSGDFVLTTEQVQPTQELQQFKQLAAVVQAALASTKEAASPSPDAQATAGATAAATAAAAAATGQHLDSSTASSSNSADGSSSSIGSCTERLSDQLTGLTLKDDAGSSSSSKPCGSGGCFRLLESHGDQVGGCFAAAADRKALQHTKCRLFCLACAVPGVCSHQVQSANCIGVLILHTCMQASLGVGHRPHAGLQRQKKCRR